MPVTKNRGQRLRTCAQCGKKEWVRSDNAAIRCKSCAAREAGLKGGAVVRSRRRTATCSHCNKVFFTSRTQDARARNRYCSKSCRRLATSVERKCKTCGSSFRVARSILNGKTNSSGNFCSRPCYERYLCRTNRTTGRGSRWTAIRREVVRSAPFCGLCGKLSRLDVHHIIPFRLTRDNGHDNLIPLCKRCHKFVEHVFIEVEPHIAGDFATAKLILRSGLRERQAATLMFLKAIWKNIRGKSGAATLAAGPAEPLHA